MAVTLTPEVRQEKLNELYELGKTKGVLTYSEIMDRLLELDMDPDQLDKVLETLDSCGVNVINDTVSSDSSASSKSDEKDELADIDLDLSVPEGVSIDDPVRMYLKVTQLSRSLSV